MAGEINGARATKGHVGALLFLTAGMTTFDAYSTLMSSPWTAEHVGADPEKANSIREYVTHAIGISMGYAVVSAAIADSSMPLLGAGVANLYLWWIYTRARARAEQAGPGRGWF